MAFSFGITKSKKGFTLIELMIVVAIMGFLTAVIAFISIVLINRARVARAQGDTSNLAKAIYQLSFDTVQYPRHFAVDDCYLAGAPNNQFELTSAADMGLLATDGLFPNWKGPYTENIPVDPWGNPYIFDQDYECDVDINVACSDYAAYADPSGNVTAVAVFSRGENESPFSGGTPPNIAYDADNVVSVICAE